MEEETKATYKENGKSCIYHEKLHKECKWWLPKCRLFGRELLTEKQNTGRNELSTHLVKGKV